MTTDSKRKLKILLAKHKPGTVCLASWLEKQGISRDLQQYYLRSGWLEPVGRGAFKRPGDEVGWRGGLYALQKQANLVVHVGGITALSTQGAGHYIPLGREKVYLFSSLGVSLPTWFRNHNWNADIAHVRTTFLPPDAGIGEAMRMELASAGGFVPVKVSDTERAMLECLYLAPVKQDLVECYQVMEGLVNLRPKVVQSLLEICTSIKVKRLFLYMAEKAGHQWLRFVDRSHINLGKGDRSITPEGVYIAAYGLSIPKTLALL